MVSIPPQFKGEVGDYPSRFKGKILGIVLNIKS